MAPFLHAHATHPDWRFALGLAGAQIDAQLDARRATQADFEPTLGWVYLTDHYAGQAQALLEELQRRWPGVAWVGGVGVGVSASGVEYFGEPALALMLSALPRERFRVFSGQQPLGGFAAHTAQVHADPATSELATLLDDLAARTTTGYLFGGLASSRTRALHVADAVLEGGLSGVAFDAGVALVSRVTQGCQPVGPLRTIGAAQANAIGTLDGRPALDCLLEDLGVAGRDPREVLGTIRQTLVGLSNPAERSDAAPLRRGAFGPDTRVRHLVGLDPAQRGIAIADLAEPGQQLAFCRRDTEAARRDLVRICAEIRDEVESELPLPAVAGPASTEQQAATPIAGAIYVSCNGRGGPHFGAPSAELAIVKHALGDVPLVGFFAAGEIARHHLYGYTGVLTVFPRQD